MKKGDKVVCLIGYEYYGPNIKTGAVFTVKSVDDEFVYLVETITNYGFYKNRFKVLTR